MASAQIKIKDLDDHITLFRDSRSGIAYVKNGKTGEIHTCHPAIDSSGSVRGMKNLGHWDKKDKVVRSIGMIHNISRSVICDEYDEACRASCRCGGNHSNMSYNMEHARIITEDPDEYFYCKNCGCVHKDEKFVVWFEEISKNITQKTSDRIKEKDCGCNN